MVNYIFLAVLLASIAVAARSKWVWATCGYDCGIFTISQGPISVVGWYLGLGGILLSEFVLAISYAKRGGRK